MKLLDVEAVLGRETDIQQTDPDREVLKELDDKTTSYAILSHRWGVEVGYEEMTGLLKMEERKRDKVRQRAGYQKIIESCKQSMQDGYKWLWVDTCCIDKRSSAELSEAINSMYRWYQNAQVCYVYLNDVDRSTFPTKQDDKFDQSNGWPEWFVRGWTLQELIAPKRIEFFNKDWVHIGNKRQLARMLEKITGILREVLTGGLAGKELSVAQIMSWAANRKTTREEDRAYSLMGLFGVNMPMLYGEGKKAFQRLQVEIIRMSSDHSIFAWNPQTPRTGSVLAEDPSDFWDCGRIRRMSPEGYVDKLIKSKDFSYLSNTDVDRRARHQHKLAALRDAVHSQQFHTFTVCSAGIQVLLPIVPSCKSPSHFRATLACYHNAGFDKTPLTIDLVSSGPSFSRTSSDSSFLATCPEFKTLYLSHQDTNETCRQFALDDEYASYHGFTRRGTYPREFTGDAVTLSCPADDLIVIVYANNETRACFAVGVGYYLGQHWVHADYCGHSLVQEKGWMDFVRTTYHRMWEARSKHARDVAEQRHMGGDSFFMKHCHLPRSIWAARVVWYRWDVGSSGVMVDVVECPGCCDGPYGMTTTCGLMDTVSRSCLLQLDLGVGEADECSGQRVALGDYGDYSDGNFVRTGNIFEDMPASGIGREDSTYCPVVSHVSTSDWLPGCMQNQDDLAVAYRYGEPPLALYQPKGISLPTNEHMSLLLKALSTRLVGKSLVKTIIQCSDFYLVDKDGKRRHSGDDSAPGSGNHSAEARILTPLCIIVRPRVWRRELLCEHRREQFKCIREHFYALVNNHQLSRTELSHKSINRQKKDIAIEFFSELFGRKHLKNFIGDITFFNRLSDVMETSPLSDLLSVNAAQEDGLRARPPTLPCTSSAMRCNLLKGGEQFTAAESDPGVVFSLLQKWHQTFLGRNKALGQFAHERQRLRGEIESISQTLGAELFEHILIAFCQPELYRTGRAHYIQYDRQLDPLSVVRDIRALQAKLDATKDMDEQRALEEDATGKILWLFWCGICAEVEELLRKVADLIRREEMMKYALQHIRGLQSEVDPSDDQVHLRRIMLDAEANTSKYQLWLEARAIGQAKFSGTNRGTLTLDTHGRTPSTSRQALSTSVA